jgi:hypothetical protein
MNKAKFRKIRGFTEIYINGRWECFLKPLPRLKMKKQTTQDANN